MLLIQFAVGVSTVRYKILLLKL